MRRIVLPVRGVGPREASYEPHELEHSRRVRGLLDHDDPGIRADAANELLVVHELKALFEGRLLTDAEMVERGDEIVARAPVASGRRAWEEKAIQTTLLPPEGTTGMFQIPPSARRKLGVVEEPTETGLAALPDPGADRIGQFSDPAVSGAPVTQRLAAVKAYYKTGSDRMRVLSLVAGSGERGMTDYEIEQALDLKHQTASARRNDLKNDGWVETTDLQRPTDTGSLATAWVLTEAGRAEWAHRSGWEQSA